MKPAMADEAIELATQIGTLLIMQLEEHIASMRTIPSEKAA